MLFVWAGTLHLPPLTPVVQCTDAVHVLPPPYCTHTEGQQVGGASNRPEPAGALPRSPAGPRGSAPTRLALGSAARRAAPRGPLFDTAISLVASHVPGWCAPRDLLFYHVSIPP